MNLPSFYVKFIKLLFSKLRIDINYAPFEKQSNNNQQTALVTTRAFDKKNMIKLYQHNLEAHRNNQAECCPIYSSNFPLIAQQLSSHPKQYSPPQLYFSNLLNELLDMKSKLGIEDYITSTQVKVTPMTK